MLEIEVKYYLGDQKTARSLADTWGLTWHEGTPELNRIFDYPDHRLERAGQLIRVREREDRGWLTYKEKTDTVHSYAKVRLEHQTSVDDPSETVEILTHLGLQEVLSYHRFRAGHPAGSTRIEFDHLPGGWFCEIEGDPDGIDEKVRAGGLEGAHSIVMSYPEIFRRLQEYNGTNALSWSFDLVKDGTFRLPPVDAPFWRD